LKTQIAETEKEKANAIAEKEQEKREKAEAQTKMANAEQLRQRANADKADTEKKLAQQGQQAQEQANQRNILFFSVFALALFGIIFLIYRNARQQRQKNIIILEQSKELKAEKEKADQLLLNILPQEVAQELKEKGITTVKHFKNASVLFADIKGFSSLAQKLSPENLIKELDFCFSKFDEIVNKYNLERIKTIGDSYMCAGGVPVANVTNPFDITLAALQIQWWMADERQKRGDDYWQIRLGIHSGELVAGVIGKTRFAYDIWGNTVNTASRMESGGEVGKVNITETTYCIIKDVFDCVPRGKIEAKNIGLIETYFVSKLKPEFAENEGGFEPNQQYFLFLEKFKKMINNL
jgi:adenylate cyclase